MSIGQDKHCRWIEHHAKYYSVQRIYQVGAIRLFIRRIYKSASWQIKLGEI